jgi:hypothetical protein
MRAVGLETNPDRNNHIDIFHQLNTRQNHMLCRSTLPPNKHLWTTPVPSHDLTVTTNPKDTQQVEIRTSLIKQQLYIYIQPFNTQYYIILIKITSYDLLSYSLNLQSTTQTIS